MCVCVSDVKKKMFLLCASLFFHSLFCLDFTEARFLSQKTRSYEMPQHTTVELKGTSRTIVQMLHFRAA